MFMFIGVEDVSGVTGVFYLGIYGVVSLGVPSVVELGVPDLFPLWVTCEVSHGIIGDATSVLPGLVFLGSEVYVTGKIFF